MRHKIFSYLFTLIGLALVALPLAVIILDAEFRSPGVLGRALQIAALPIGLALALGFGASLLALGHVIRRDMGDRDEQ